MTHVRTVRVAVSFNGMRIDETAVFYGDQGPVIEGYVTAGLLEVVTSSGEPETGPGGDPQGDPGGVDERAAPRRPRRREQG